VNRLTRYRFHNKRCDESESPALGPLTQLRRWLDRLV
jgi:hypothetical protein